MSEKVIIDAAGFRLNVGIVLANQTGQLLLARRVNNVNAWQFPQGGIQVDETPRQAMYRELSEELGLLESDVVYITETPGWLSYRLPESFQRPHLQPLCVGQKQKWFLLRLSSADEAIALDQNDHPEFDQWKWATYWDPLEKIIAFKRDVYQAVLETFSDFV